MSTKAFLITIIVAAGCVITVIMWNHAPVVDQPAPEKTAATLAARDEPSVLGSMEVLPGTNTETNVEAVIVPASAPEKTPVTAPTKKTAATPKEPLHDPGARVALSLVGSGDPDAEAYWLGAIYDTGLPDAEREDLMEDLNEDGLSDPKHPGSQDLPLILNRIALIEKIAPSADDFMLEHLGEAYKDLNNMLAGKPVP